MAATINESWMRRKARPMIGGEVVATLPLLEPRLEPLELPEFGKRALPESFGEPAPLKRSVAVSSVAVLLAEFDPFSANFVE